MKVDRVDRNAQQLGRQGHRVLHIEDALGVQQGHDLPVAQGGADGGVAFDLLVRLLDPF